MNTTKTNMSYIIGRDCYKYYPVNAQLNYTTFKKIFMSS